MEIVKGYKRTEVGLIPEEWKIHKVKDLIDLLTDYDANGSFESVAQNVNVYDHEEYAWYVRSTDLENNSKLDKVRYVDESSYKFLKKTSLYGGELLFLKRGDIGNVYLFEMKTHRATVAPNLYLLKLNQISDSKYLFYYFISNYGQRQLKSKNASSTLGALYKDDVKSILVPLPPTIAEQTAIADALSNIDELISQTEKLIDKKKAIKQGVMQELLKPKEGWEKKKMSTIFKIFKGKGLSKSKLSESGSQSCILYGELFTKYHNEISNVFSKTNHNEGIPSEPGDILFPGSTTTTGADLAKASTISIPGVQLGGDIIIVRKVTDEIDPFFITYFLNIFRKNEIAQMTKGITIHHLYGKDLYDIQIEYPSIKEQSRISGMLKEFESELNSLEKYFSKLKLQKQGMMQALLTGKIRLL